MGANAGAAYRGDQAAGKRPVRAGEPRGQAMPSRAAFRAPTGRVWRYSGKRGVLVMLAYLAEGVTRWDTLP